MKTIESYHIGVCTVGFYIHQVLLRVLFFLALFTNSHTLLSYSTRLKLETERKIMEGKELRNK